MAGDAFAIELAMARMAVGMAHRNKTDSGCNGLVYQVRRLEEHYREAGDADRADKIARILTWYDAGGPASADVVSLSDWK